MYPKLPCHPHPCPPPHRIRSRIDLHALAIFGSLGRSSTHRQAFFPLEAQVGNKEFYGSWFEVQQCCLLVRVVLFDKCRTAPGIHNTIPGTSNPPLSLPSHTRLSGVVFAVTQELVTMSNGLAVLAPQEGVSLSSLPCGPSPPAGALRPLPPPPPCVPVPRCSHLSRGHWRH